jgi:hypothetical protein
MMLLLRKRHRIIEWSKSPLRRHIFDRMVGYAYFFTTLLQSVACPAFHKCRLQREVH